jgi:hypothetical protein
MQVGAPTNRHLVKVPLLLNGLVLTAVLGILSGKDRGRGGGRCYAEDEAGWELSGGLVDTEK